jgi:hypothetical protein
VTHSHWQDKDGIWHDGIAPSGNEAKNIWDTVKGAWQPVDYELPNPSHGQDNSHGHVNPNFGRANSQSAKPTAKALTHDEGKDPLATLPWAAVRAMSKVQAYGHTKYKDFYNYRKGLELTRNLSCAIRHIADFIEGEDLDPESQQNHLAHAMCRLAFVLQNIHDGAFIDDRYTSRSAQANLPSAEPSTCEQPGQKLPTAKPPRQFDGF